MLRHNVLLDVHVLDSRHLRDLKELGAAYARKLVEEGVAL
jgi:hypothetical protein